MAMMDPFLGGNNAPPYPRRLASLTKTSSLGASTKQYAAQFRRPNYESPGTPTHTSFLDDLDAEINQELQQFRSGKAWQHGTMYKNRSGRHGVVLESIQRPDKPLGPTDLGASKDRGRVPEPSPAIVKVPPRPLGHLSPLPPKSLGPPQDHSAAHIALLRDYYGALALERHCGSFANVEAHFEALLHDDVRINTGGRTYTKEDWRCILTDMVYNDVVAKHFIVQRHGPDFVVYCLTLMIGGNVSYLKSKATFRHGKCLLIEPCPTSDGPHHALHKRVLEAFYAALDPARHANAFATFEGVFQSLVHDRFATRTDSQALNKADWAAYWQRLVEGGVLATKLTLQYSEGDVAGYSVRLEVGGTSAVLHDQAAFEDGRIVGIDPLDPSALPRLAMAAKPPPALRSPGARAIRRQSLDSAAPQAEAAPAARRGDPPAVLGLRVAPTAPAPAERRDADTAQGASGGTPGALGCDALFLGLGNDRVPMGLAALQKSRGAAAPECPQAEAAAPFLGAHRSIYVARAQLAVRGPSPAPRVGAPRAPAGGDAPMPGVANLVHAASGARLRGLGILSPKAQAAAGSVPVLRAASSTPPPQAALGTSEAGIALLLRAYAASRMGHASGLQTLERCAHATPAGGGIGLLLSASSTVPGLQRGLQALDAARAPAAPPLGPGSLADGIGLLLSASSTVPGLQRGLQALDAARAPAAPPPGPTCLADGLSLLKTAAIGVPWDATGLRLLERARPYPHLSVVLMAAEGGACGHLHFLRMAIAQLAAPELPAAPVGDQPGPALGQSRGAALGSLATLIEVAGDRRLPSLERLGLTVGLESPAAHRPEAVSPASESFDTMASLISLARDAGIKVPSLQKVAMTAGIPLAPSPEPQDGGVLHKLLLAASKAGGQRSAGLVMLQRLRERGQRPVSSGVQSLLSGARALDLHNADGLVMLQYLSARGS